MCQLLNVEKRCHTLRLSFLGPMCAQDDVTSDFWKEDPRKVFLSLGSVHLNDREACCMPPIGGLPFCREYRHALSVLSRLRRLVPLTAGHCRERALYRTLVWGPYEMTWSASPVWRRSRVAYCSLGLPGWDTSITARHYSPGYWSETLSGLARDCLQLP